MTLTQLRKQLDKLAKQLPARTPVRIVAESQMIDEIDGIHFAVEINSIVVYTRPYFAPQHPNQVPR